MNKILTSVYANGTIRTRNVNIDYEKKKIKVTRIRD